MVRIFGTPGRSRRLRVGIAIGACMALILVMALPAFAVHELDFQLDGNIATSPDTNVGGNTQEIDWQDLFDANGDTNSLPTGFEKADLDRDFNTNTNGSFNTADSSTFATGSKDTLPITPGWQCNQDNNVNSKTDVMNAYAASYVVDSSDPEDDGDEIMYFGLERNANTGTGNVGFWFLGDGTVDCSSSGSTTAFTGDHQDGDVLVVSEFTQGGTVSTIFAYKWVGDSPGSLDPNPIAQGASCSGAAVDDDICAQVNTGTLNNIPWLTANKQDNTGHSLRVSEFFEGGINLTDAGLGGECFNTFIGDTRSSTSLTATIFDFSRGSLGGCTSEITTTPKQAGDPDPTNITSEPIPATGQLEVMDSALVEVDGADTFDAEVTFFLCRESELVDGNGDPDPAGTCATGGTQIGTAKAVTSSPATVVSDTAGLTAAERYCWRGEFSGDEDAGVPADTDSSSAECFEVTPLTPTLTTSASGDVVLGNPIYDTISLTGTADTPGSNGIGPDGTIDATDRQPAGGTISVTAYGPDDPTCTTEAVGNPAVDWPVSIDVSGDSATYGGSGSVTEFTPVAVGTYTFVASYSGDSPNTNGAGPSACDDAAEQVIVTGEAAVATAQDWLPNDTATITGPTALSGTVTFTLYTGTDCNAGNDDTVVYGPEQVAVSGASPQHPETSNTSVVVEEADSGGYSWLVSYDDDSLGDPDPTCETTTITIDDTP